MLKRKMLSMKSSTSRPWSRKYSAIVNPVRATRKRTPGGSFICPKTITVSFITPLSSISRYSWVPSRVRSPTPANTELPWWTVGDRADELLDDDGLAHARAAEDARLSALGERGDQVDHLHSGFENLHPGGLLVERGGEVVDRIVAGRRAPRPARRSAGRARRTSARAWPARPERGSASGWRWRANSCAARRWCPSRCSAPSYRPGASAPRARPVCRPRAPLPPPRRSPGDDRRGTRSPPRRRVSALFCRLHFP